MQQAVGADILGNVVELLPPTLFSWFARQYSQAGLADRIAPVHNLIVSNVPGRRCRSTLAGAGRSASTVPGRSWRAPA